MTRCELEDSRSRSIDARALLLLVRIGSGRDTSIHAFFRPLLKSISTYLPTYLSTYLSTSLPTNLPSYPATYVSVRRNIQLWFDATVRHPVKLFSHKTKKPISCRCHRLRRYFLVSRSLARRRSHPFPFHFPSIAASAKLREEVQGWVQEGCWPGGGEKGRFQDGHYLVIGTPASALI